MAEKPRRASLIIIRNNRVLLARDDTLDFWSLPGGRIEPGESDVRHHRVFRITVNEAEPVPGKEIGDLKWWDGREPINHASSLTPILSHPTIAFLPAQG